MKTGSSPHHRIGAQKTGKRGVERLAEPTCPPGPPAAADWEVVCTSCREKRWPLAILEPTSYVCGRCRVTPPEKRAARGRPARSRRRPAGRGLRVDLGSLAAEMSAGAISLPAGFIGAALRERTATDTVIPPLTTKGEAMAKGKPKPEKVPFGGYTVCFKGCTDTLESLFGSAPMPPPGMTKRLWEHVKRHRVATKG